MIKPEVEEEEKTEFLQKREILLKVLFNNFQNICR